MALTEKRIRDAKPGEATRIEWDDEVKGLGLRITPTGVKAFILNYRSDGRERRMTLGRAGEVSLSQVRKQSIEAKQLVKAGADPLAESRARRDLPTVAEALDRFEAEYIPKRMAKGRMAESTANEYRRQIGRHLRPALGRKRVRDVTRQDVERMLAKSPADTRVRKQSKTATGAPLPPVTANRVLALTSKLFRCCEDWGWRPQYSNPARGVEKAVEEARDRTLSSDELSALGRALAGMNANEGAILAIRLAALTGLRIGEIRSMRWGDVDLQSGVLTLPKTKTGRRLHTLPTAALALLADARRLGDCVVPGRDPSRPLNERAIRRVFENACETAGIEGVTLHDLRRTIMTQAAAMGVGAHLLRDMVGHKTTAMADRYVRSAGEPLAELRERMGAGMAALLDGTDKANVVDIRGKHRA